MKKLRESGCLQLRRNCLKFKVSGLFITSKKIRPRLSFNVYPCFSLQLDICIRALSSFFIDVKVNATSDNLEAISLLLLLLNIVRLKAYLFSFKIIIHLSSTRSRWVFFSWAVIFFHFKCKVLIKITRGSQTIRKLST